MIFTREEFEITYEYMKEAGIKGSLPRLEYEQKVRELQTDADRLYGQGLEEETIARALHQKRRDIGLEYKNVAPPNFREYILYATAQKYGDPLGPTYEDLRKYKTDREIIESSSRPIRDLDERLTLDGFRQWAEAQLSD